MGKVPLHVGGLVLCGGRSRRMGRPKAWLPFGAQPMLPHVVGRLRPAVAPVVVVAAPGQDLPELPADVQVVRDQARGRGPLQGLAAGLRALAGRVDAAFVSSCDAPLLTAPFIHRMIELLGAHPICVPWIDGIYHPLAAVYRIDVLAAVEKLLAADCLRLTSLLEEQPTLRVTADQLIDVDPRLHSLRNLNTPNDYAEALQIQAATQ